MTDASSGRPPTSELQRYLVPFDPDIAELALTLRALVLEEAPDASEMVFEAGISVTVAFTYTGRFKEVFCSVAAYEHHVNLGFPKGAELPDPDGWLQGTGRLGRHLKVRWKEELPRIPLRHFVRLAVERARAERDAARPS